MCSSKTKSLNELLKDAFWHEKQDLTDRFSIIEYMASDFIKNQIVHEQFLADILRRESVCHMCDKSRASLFTLFASC